MSIAIRYSGTKIINYFVIIYMLKVYQRNGKLLKMVCLEVTRYIKMQNLFWAANVLPSKKTGTFKQFIHINSYLRLKYLVEYRTRHHRDMICVQMNNIFTSFWLRFYIQFISYSLTLDKIWTSCTHEIKQSVYLNN